MSVKMESQSMSDAVGEHLRQYEIGAKIRALRLAKGIGLVQLGRHSGLSAGLLSKIERGLLVPPLQTLVRIAMVFGVGLEHFFSEQAGPLAFVTRKQDRLRLPNDPALAPPAYFFESLDYPATDRPMDAYIAEFHHLSTPHNHPGPELVYVMRGQLLLRLGNADFEVGSGDSIYFDSGHDHSYRSHGRVPCRGLVVVARNALARERLAPFL
jgi:transcriptional regulator with XRE-family HTH domain